MNKTDNVWTHFRMKDDSFTKKVKYMKQEGKNSRWMER